MQKLWKILLYNALGIIKFNAWLIRMMANDKIYLLKIYTIKNCEEEAFIMSEQTLSFYLGFPMKFETRYATLKIFEQRASK